MLQGGGHELAVAADHADGVARARLVRPNIAFICIGLPTYDGYEVCGRIRDEFGRAITLVALAG
jgi:CheY-like chemotaxis protein